MRHQNLAALLLALSLFLPTVAMGQSAEAKADLGANAALKYWTAFALLPNLDKDQEKLLENCTKAPLDAAALSLLDKSQPSRVYLHRGAKLERCDWSEDYEEGIRLLLPHLSKSRTLANLGTLHARHEFEQGHWQAGTEDIAALLKLARHLETDHLIIPSLVGWRIERMAIEATAPYLPELKPVVAGTLSAVLDVPSTGATLPQMVRMEKELGAMWLIQELKEAERHKKGSWQGVWDEMFNWTKEPEWEVAKSVRTFEQAIKGLEDVLPVYDELEKMVALPWKEFDAQYPEFMRKAKAVNPVGGLLLPAMHKAVTSQRRMITERALFRAAITVVQEGPDKIKDTRDPFGDGAFEYRALDKGFELKSKFLVEGKPLTLTVGPGRK
jgi:hypothetical protein